MPTLVHQSVFSRGMEAVGIGSDDHGGVNLCLMPQTRGVAGVSSRPRVSSPKPQIEPMF